MIFSVFQPVIGSSPFHTHHLINYYCEKYDNIYLLIKKDTQNIIDFYTKNITNIKLVYLDKCILDSNGCGRGLNYSSGWISESRNNLLNIVKSIKINKQPRSKSKPSDHTPIELEIN